MPQPPPAAPVADTAPDAEVLTRYDEQHLVTYLRLLDADREEKHEPERGMVSEARWSELTDWGLPNREGDKPHSV